MYENYMYDNEQYRSRLTFGRLDTATLGGDARGMNHETHAKARVMVCVAT